jgi:hypothetical protein
MTSKTQKLRDALCKGASGTAYDIAKAADVDYNFALMALSKMKAAGLVKVIDKVKLSNGSYFNVYEPRAAIHDADMPNRPRPEYSNGTIDLSGYKGLICAIFLQAVRDAKTTRASIRNDALSFFESDAYGFYMDWLGLNPDLKPEFMREAGR